MQQNLKRAGVAKNELTARHEHQPAGGTASGSLEPAPPSLKTWGVFDWSALTRNSFHPRGHPPSPPRAHAPERQSAGLRAARGRGCPASPSAGWEATRPSAATSLGTECPGEHLAPPGWTHLSVPLLSTQDTQEHTLLKKKRLDAALKHNTIIQFFPGERCD